MRNCTIHEAKEKGADLRVFASAKSFSHAAALMKVTGFSKIY